MTKAVNTENRKSAPGLPLSCWECKTALVEEGAGPAHFCRECNKVQPFPAGTNFFAFFGLKPLLALDAAALERRYHQLSWKLHPDRFHNASSYEQELSLELTAVLNDGWRTLHEPVARAGYLLRLEGIRKEGEVKQQAPQDLLMEVFELNEHLEELRATRRAGGDARQVDDLKHQLEKARHDFQHKMDAVLADLTACFATWDELVERNNADPVARRAVLEPMNEILNRHNYIRNLVENVTDELGG